MNDTSLKIKFLILCAWTCLILINPSIWAQSISNDHKVTICPSVPDSNQFPDFDGSHCFETTVNKINPQDAEIWVKTEVEIDEYLRTQTLPVAFFIYGKAASRVYLNGQLLGSNGDPGSSVATEKPGLMDSVFYVKKNQLIEGQNQLLIKMSTHHGFLKLAHPINWLGFGPYRNPTNSVMEHYWLSLLPFGAFILAAIYLAVLSVKQQDRKSIIFLSAMSLFAASQLLVEVTRGITAYQYPFQDIRLMLIVLFSTGFGMSLFTHIAVKFLPNNIVLSIGGVLLMTLLIQWFAQSFDLKASLGILLPTIYASFICLYAVIKSKPHAKGLTIALLLFTVVFFIDSSLFLDRYFYYVVACLMLFLFVQQAIAHANEKTIHEKEKARADQLQLIIDQNNEKINPANLKVTSAGKVEIIPANHIAFCKGAGDYVELVMLDNSNVLYNGSLKQLEGLLPSVFLKVHRSYIVNTTQIQSLQRNTSGTGELILSNKLFVPVSRRIMPHVREKLA